MLSSILIQTSNAMDMALQLKKGNGREAGEVHPQVTCQRRNQAQGQSTGGCFHDGKAVALVLRSGGAKIQNIKRCNLL